MRASLFPVVMVVLMSAPVLAAAERRGTTPGVSVAPPNLEWQPTARRLFEQPNLQLERDPKVPEVPIRTAAVPVAEERQAGGPRLNAEFRKELVYKVLDQLLAERTLSYVVPTNIGRTAIDVDVKDLSPEQAVRKLAELPALAGYKLQVQLQDRIFRLQPAKTPDAAEDPKLIYNFRQVPLRQAVDALLSYTPYTAEIAANVPNVVLNISVRDVPALAGLSLMVSQAADSIPGLARRQVGKTIRLQVEGAPVPALHNEEARTNTRISGSFKQVPTFVVFRSMLQPFGLTFTLDGEGLNQPISVSYRNVLLKDALAAVMQEVRRIAPAARLRRQRDQYILDVREPEPCGTDPQAAEPEAPPAPAPDSADEKITLAMKNVPLRHAVALVLQGSEFTYRVEPNVPDILINLSVRDVNRVAVLRLLIRQASVQVRGLTLRREGKQYVIHIRPPAAELKVTDCGPSSADPPPAEFIWQKLPLQYLDVTLTARLIGVPMFPGTPARSGRPNASPVEPSLKPVAFQGNIDGGFPSLLGPEGGDRITLELKSMPLHQALKELLQNTDVTLVIAPDVPSVSVSGLFPNAQRDTILRQIMRQATEQAPRLTYRVENGVLAVRMRPEPTAPAPAKSRLGNIQPGNGLPAGIMGILGIKADNSLLVYGTAEAIADLRQLLRMLDVPQRQVQLRLSSGTLVAEGMVLAGGRLQLADTQGNQQFKVTLQPRLTGNDSIEVALEGTLTVGGVSRPIQSLVRVKAGSATPVLSLGEGARTVKVWLRAAPVKGS